MTMSEETLTMSFCINRLSAAEQTLGKRIVDIVEELEGGAPSLTTLRALTAAGISPYANLIHGAALSGLDLKLGTEAIERHGTKACAEAIGAAMSAFLAKIA